ncbi:lipoate--protein ligase [Acholeplasma laidlawii]|nr:lipoate--protein ligase [Acholeplasma laidlawii]PII02948.1 lipoate--protein ligase [Acholeplasma laidlawii]
MFIIFSPEYLIVPLYNIIMIRLIKRGNKMKTIHAISQDPYFNLAWEEYIFKHIHKDEDIFLLWQNAPSIIIGRNQNVFEEVYLDYIVKHHIPLIRRNSGGGTVYHDLGNINFSFMTSAKGTINNYKLMTEKIREALKKLGIPVEFIEKSDLKVNGLKVSGNSQFVFKDKLLHHGTLLFDSNLDTLNSVIKPKHDAIDSIGVKSNRSLVTNLKEYTSLSIEEFKAYLLKEISGESEVLELSTKDIKKIEMLKEERYLSFNWNYGQSTKSTIIKSLGDYSIKLTVSFGHVEDCFIMHEGTVALSLSSSLVGERLFPTDLSFLKKKAPEVYQMLFE